MVTVRLYVEGGGDSSTLKTECRRAFSELLRKAGCGGKMPRIVACGSRENAYDSFRTAVKNGERALLLVDSESPVDASCMQELPSRWRPWRHLAEREGDGWEKPEGTDDACCHLMVECMENWLLSDCDALKVVFGKNFHEDDLPNPRDVEQLSKSDAQKRLRQATVNCPGGPYGKGKHSFKVLAKLSSDNLERSCRWAKRFFDFVRNLQGNI